MAVSAAFLRQIWQAGNKEIITSRSISRAIGVAFFVAGTCLGAFVRIPLFFTPVPVTLQTFFVMLSGAVLGKKYGSISQILYVGLGCAGLQIFAQANPGIGYLFGPTGGYLMGFILSSYIIGTLVRKNQSFIWIAFSLFLGEAVLFSTGMFWLKEYMNLSLQKAFLLGVVPFIPGDSLKLLAAASIYKGLHRRFSEIF